MTRLSPGTDLAFPIIFYYPVLFFTKYLKVNQIYLFSCKHSVGLSNLMAKKKTTNKPHGKQWI